MDVERITPEEVYEHMQEDGDIVLLDVRRASWNESDVKAKGAIRINPDEIEEHLDELLKDKLIAAYCT